MRASVNIGLYASDEDLADVPTAQVIVLPDDGRRFVSFQIGDVHLSFDGFDLVALAQVRLVIAALTRAANELEAAIPLTVVDCDVNPPPASEPERVV